MVVNPLEAQLKQRKERHAVARAKGLKHIDARRFSTVSSSARQVWYQSPEPGGHLGSARANRQAPAGRTALRSGSENRRLRVPPKACEQPEQALSASTTEKPGDPGRSSAHPPRDRHQKLGRPKAFGQAGATMPNTPCR
jgi:hypothetical protein